MKALIAAPAVFCPVWVEFAAAQFLQHSFFLNRGARLTAPVLTWDRRLSGAPAPAKVATWRLIVASEPWTPRGEGSFLPAAVALFFVGAHVYTLLTGRIPRRSCTVGVSILVSPVVRGAAFRCRNQFPFYDASHNGVSWRTICGLLLVAPLTNAPVLVSSRSASTNTGLTSAHVAKGSGPIGEATPLDASPQEFGHPLQ